MKILTSAPAALALAVLASALLGCTSAPFGTATNTYTVGETGKPDAVIGDRDLASKFVLVGIHRERKDGRLHIQFDLQNTTPGDLRIEWTVTWRDSSGFTIDSGVNWRPTVVSGKGFQPIQLTAPTPEAAEFQLHFRKPTPIS